MDIEQIYKRKQYSRIGEYDKCCLNCRFWVINTQLFGPADGVICEKGYGHTAPDSYCDEFDLEFDDYGCLEGGGYTGGDRDDKLLTYLNSEYAE